MMYSPKQRQVKIAMWWARWRDRLEVFACFLLLVICLTVVGALLDAAARA